MLDKEKLQSSNTKNVFSLTEIAPISVKYRAEYDISEELLDARGSFGLITSLSVENIPVFSSNAFNPSNQYTEVTLNYAFRASDIALLPELSDVPFSSTLAALKQDLSGGKFGDTEEYQSHVWILGVVTDDGRFNYTGEFDVATNMGTRFIDVDLIGTSFTDGSNRRWLVFDSNGDFDPVKAEESWLLFGNGFEILIRQMDVISIM